MMFEVIFKVKTDTAKILKNLKNIETKLNTYGYGLYTMDLNLDPSETWDSKELRHFLKKFGFKNERWQVLLQKPKNLKIMIYTWEIWKCIPGIIRDVYYGEKYWICWKQLSNM